MAGPGTELKKLIPAWAAKNAKGCGCNDYAKKMDKWGPDRCERNRRSIVGHLVSQTKYLPAALQKLPRPLLRAAADKMLTVAIDRARRDERA